MCLFSFAAGAAAALLFLFRAFGGVSDASVDEGTGASTARKKNTIPNSPHFAARSAKRPPVDAAARARNEIINLQVRPPAPPTAYPRATSLQRRVVARPTQFFAFFPASRRRAAAPRAAPRMRVESQQCDTALRDPKARETPLGRPRGRSRRRARYRRRSRAPGAPGFLRACAKT